MYRALILIALTLSASPFIRESLARQTVIALIDAARPEFTRDLDEIEEIILEIQNKSDRDFFEEILLKELQRYQKEINSNSNLAKLQKSSASPLKDG